jgi:hypothetical protein
VKLRLSLLCGLVLAVAMISGAWARDFEMGSDSEYPNSIMAPEPGTRSHHHARMSARARHLGARPPAVTSQEPVMPLARQETGRAFPTVRGSSGSVLPTPLPRTPLIPPEGGGTLTTHALPQEQGPTVLPGASNPIPNLPHGPETFQDRASRCATQQSLYNVPGTLRSQYMGSCVQ